MSVQKSSIFLGDVAAAIRKLEVAGKDEDLIRLIIGMLGSDLQPESVPAGPVDTRPPISTAGANEEELSNQVAKSPSAAEPASVRPAPTTIRWLPCTIETRVLDEPARDAAALFADTPPLPPPKAAALDSADLALADPLFEPMWSRGIFTALLATYRDGAIDLDALIEKVARFEHVDRLPAEAVPTLHRGAQVLVDASTGMTPFFADQGWALDEIERVVGRDLVRILTFMGLPDRGIAMGIAEQSKPYCTPPPGTPVVLLSDLGIGRPGGTSDRASADEWASFARRVRSAGCPLIALLPYTPARWPQQLRALVTMVHWDPRTTTGRLRAIIGPAHHRN